MSPRVYCVPLLEGGVRHGLHRRRRRREAAVGLLPFHVEGIVPGPLPREASVDRP